MAEKNKSSLLLDTERLELEKTCVYFISAYVRMLEKLKADHLTKGPVMSTQRESENGCCSDNHFESSVDPPLANKELSLIYQVHESVPSRNNIPIPNELPQNMREHPFQVRREDFDDLYRVQDAVPSVEREELSRAELVMMYLRSFRNILEDDLSSFEELWVRIIGHMGIVLADVLQLCYPTFGGAQLNDQLYADFTAYKNELRQQ